MENLAVSPEAKSNATPARRSLISALSPAMRWALLSCLFVALVFSVISIIVLFRYYGFIVTLTASLIIIAAVIIVAVVVTLLFAALKRMHWQTYLIVVVSIFLCITAMLLLVYLAPLLIFCLIAVYFAIMCATGRYSKLRKLKRILRYFLLGLFGALTALMLFLTLWPGPALKPGDRPDKAVLALPYADRIQAGFIPDLDDPSTSGNFSYQVYYYATPGQKSDPYPGHDAIPAPTVDASEMVEGWNGIRKWQLGFEADALPLNAKVWMPEGSGPFPLALFVHGNHDAADRSDDGYAYLCELLASRGMIAVSADENFLNSSPLYDVFIIGGLKNEDSARAFVLLEHLRLLHEWNAGVSHPFSGKVDFDNIALIGHSRGGEAVALAAAFADLNHYPDNGRVAFDYPFRIKSVVAIAPVHRMYDPAGLEVSLKNVNYLVMHGGHDMDVSSFMGANMYSRADVTGYGIKAHIWIQHANHGQFNTSWGVNDVPGLGGLIANKKLLMPTDEQQQAAKVFISAFLESTLKGKEGYNALFHDFAHGSEWLPPDIYITDYTESGAVLLDSFDGGFDIGTSTSDLVAYSADGFDIWTQTEFPGKQVNSNRVLLLQWGSEEYIEKYGSQAPVFRMDFAENAVSAGDRLYVSLCSGKEQTGEPGVSFQIRLTDSAGRSALMSIDDFGGVVDPVETPIYKPLYLDVIGKREPVLQMVCIPTERFEGLSGSIASMEWIMDTEEPSKAGQILYADDLRVGKGSWYNWV